MTSAAFRVINNSRDLDEEYHRKLPPAIYIGHHTTTFMWNSLRMIFHILYGLEATHVAQNRNIFDKVQCSRRQHIEEEYLSIRKMSMAFRAYSGGYTTSHSIHFSDFE